MGDVASKPAKLTDAQRKCVFPGPGNPEYARGPLASMKALERLGFVKDVNTWSSVHGGRGGRLTQLGADLRVSLATEAGRAALEREGGA